MSCILHGIDTEAKLSDIWTALSNCIKQDCSCSFTLQQHFFSCLGTEDSETVVYIAELSYTVIPGVVDVPSLLTSWVDSGPAIIMNSIQLQVDTTCPVVIDSLKPEGCIVAPPTPPTDTPTDPPADVTVIAVVTCVILLLVVVTVVAAVVVAESSQSTSMCQHHTTTPCTQLSLGGLVLCSVPGALWWYAPQCCVHLLMCRPKRPLPNPVYEYEYMGSGPVGVALTNMMKKTRRRTTRMRCCPLKPTRRWSRETPHMVARGRLQMMCMCM